MRLSKVDRILEGYFERMNSRVPGGILAPARQPAARHPGRRAVNVLAGVLCAWILASALSPPSFRDAAEAFVTRYGVAEVLEDGLRKAFSHMHAGMTIGRQ